MLRKRCLGDKGGGTGFAAIGDPGGVERSERVVSEESEESEIRVGGGSFVERMGGVLKRPGYNE